MEIGVSIEQIWCAGRTIVFTVYHPVPLQLYWDFFLICKLLRIDTLIFCSCFLPCGLLSLPVGVSNPVCFSSSSTGPSIIFFQGEC